ncbi:putative transporter [Campylobacter sp. MIT 21-1685]|uniref:putative transporter n=1 Tax=unclassified Campylobacter TaxID=2593542 RepID=UPI00224B4E6F|nr:MULTISPECIES: putative transporter [unclassified Campylobacter]MCX2683080.1 putative transporter [Campylobacter sp. MIT 21-1684]MCX2751362.1 putative transporter [Campylobacter sp. MIT 21-1682]MCX2807561.1 putative transporter [Campylobacter sp. MIT 21-1685]
MFSSFFLSKKWFLWAYMGFFFTLVFLYIQTSLNVAINEWYKDFYNVLQKPHPIQTELLQENNPNDINQKKLQEQANENAKKALEGANFLNKSSLAYYQFLLKTFFQTQSIAMKQYYDINDFYTLIIVFLCIALPYVIIATINIYFASIYAFKWREAMTFSYLQFWKNKDDNIEGSSQRIQEDTYNFSKIVESLGLAFIKALMTLIAFIPILWGLSGSVSEALLSGIDTDSTWYFLRNVDGLLVYVALFISLGGLFISWFIGIKLPGLEYNNQKAEAAFRKELVFAEDNRQKYAKNETMFELFTGLKLNYKKLFLHYGYFNIWLILFEQIIIIIPFLAMAPSLFTGIITLGVVMQINNAFDQVRSSFSVFITNWTTITQLRSIYKRLNEFEMNIAYKKGCLKNKIK